MLCSGDSNMLVMLPLHNYDQLLATAFAYEWSCPLQPTSFSHIDIGCIHPQARFDELLLPHDPSGSRLEFVLNLRNHRIVLSG